MRPVKSMRRSLHGFHNILNIARSNKAKLIYPSSGNIYGKVTSPQSEDLVPNPQNLYAISKLIWEDMSRLTTDITSIGLRIFAGYGIGEEHKEELASVVTVFLNEIMNGKSPIIWGDGNQTRDFIYIDDIIDGIIEAVNVDTSTVVNLGTGVSTSFNELISIINNYLDTNVKPIYIDKPKSYVEKTRADTTYMKKLLKINPIDLKQGLKKYINRR